MTIRKKKMYLGDIDNHYASEAILRYLQIRLPPRGIPYSDLHLVFDWLTKSKHDSALILKTLDELLDANPEKFTTVRKLHKPLVKRLELHVNLNESMI